MTESEQITAELLKNMQSAELREFLDFNQQVQKTLNSENVPINSYSTLTAQNASLCKTGFVESLGLKLNYMISRENTELGMFEKAVLELQVLYGLRISEVLNIKPAQIMPSGQITIKGLKGSCDRFVVPVIYNQYWIQIAKSNCEISKSYNRFYFYRLYKKHGISKAFADNKKASVTHLLRYYYIANLVKSGKDIREIATIIGHKSLISTLVYVNNLK